MTQAAGAEALVEELFRREFARLVSALARLLGPSHLALAEDVVSDALAAAVQAWRLGPPENPAAWILGAARNRAIDVLRRERRFAGLAPELAAQGALAGVVDAALSPAADASNQLTLMFAICDGALGEVTHVTLILRLLCGFSAAESARAFLVDAATVERRLQRGRARLEELGALVAPATTDEVRARQPSVERALYLLFNEGYHGSDPENPLSPALCADALRLAELLLDAPGVEPASVHALAALFCFNAARLGARLDAEGVVVPLADQDRARWDRALFERGVRHLGASATGDAFTRFHLEAGIAFEHTSAPSLAATNWARIVEYFDALAALSQSPIVAMNRALACAELHGPDAGRGLLNQLAAEPKLLRYSFFWAARADLERRSGRASEALAFYQRAVELAPSRAERLSYERRLRELGH
jgi:RNA polymerase sigma factor (sigma-70 family)